jgi:hypothetical protein
MLLLSITQTALPAHLGPGALVWLGVGLVALALVVAVVFWRLRGSAARANNAERAAMAALPMGCPACRRSYPAGTVFCAVDACRLVATAEGATVERAAAGGRCPRCRRVYEAGVRFCAVDADELVALPLWQAAHATEGGMQFEGEEGEVPAAGAGGAGGDARRSASPRIAAVHFHGDGKICPVCASKYDLEASFCGRDGSELVTVN